MNKYLLGKWATDFGKSQFAKPLRSTHSQIWLVGLLIFLFILAAFSADLWPCKNVSPGYPAANRFNVLALTMNLKINPAMRYSAGNHTYSFLSLPYVATVKLVYMLIPYRLLCLRAVSVFSNSVALFFLYRLAVILFCPPVGILFVLLLVTSPVYIENMRSFDYIPLTNAIVAIACYFVVASLNNRRVAVKIAFLAFFSLLTLSLYAAGRLIVVLAIGFFGLYFKKDWKKLLLFLCLFISSILILDKTLDDTHFDLIRSNFGVGGFEKIPINKQFLERGGFHSFKTEEIKRIRCNLNTAFYYFSLKHREFFNKDDNEWQKPDRLFNIVYLPFFFIGLVTCLWKGKRSNIFLILWFCIFFFTMFVTPNLPVRRIACALAPIYLIIALGLWLVFRFLSRIFSLAKHSLKVAYFSLTFLVLVGSCDLHEFFLKAAKPYYNYSHEQLKKLAIYTYELGRGVNAIRYNRPTAQLIWGNSYFDSHFINKGMVNKLEFDAIVFGVPERPRPRRPRGIKKQVEYAKEEGGNILYIHSFPKREPGCDLEDDFWHYSDIQWVEKNLGGEVVISQIPGIEEVYFMLVK